MDKERGGGESGKMSVWVEKKLRSMLCVGKNVAKNNLGKNENKFDPTHIYSLNILVI